MKKNLKRLTAVGLALGSSMLLSAPSASAATASSAFAAATKGSNGNTTAAGTATVAWSSYTHLSPISMSIRDTACDGHDVYMRFKVYYAPGSYWRSTERRNTSNCSSIVSWSGLYLNDNRGIIGLQLTVCVDDWGGDTCANSQYTPNPQASSTQVPNALSLLET